MVEVNSRKDLNSPVILSAARQAVKELLVQHEMSKSGLPEYLARQQTQDPFEIVDEILRSPNSSEDQVYNATEAEAYGILMILSQERIKQRHGPEILERIRTQALNALNPYRDGDQEYSIEAVSQIISQTIEAGGQGLTGLQAIEDHLKFFNALVRFSVHSVALLNSK